MYLSPSYPSSQELAPHPLGRLLKLHRASPSTSLDGIVFYSKTIIFSFNNPLRVIRYDFITEEYRLSTIFKKLFKFSKKITT